mgnify:CR=1 FL=1
MMRTKFFLIMIALLLFMQSCRVSIINSQWFNYNNVPQKYIQNENNDNKSFIVLKTGDKIFADKIEYTTKQTKKKHFVVTVDGKMYTTENVASFQVDQTHYYVTFDNKSYRKLVEGKLSVYGLDVLKMKKDFRGFWTEVWDTYYYYTVDNKNKLNSLNNIKEISSAFSGCPQAQAMFKGNYFSVYNKLGKSQNELVYEAIHFFNNGCK